MHVIATAGHVDHGKSTLIRRLTGMEPDRWSEERRRGLTIDLGFAWTRLDNGETMAFVDVPGHERFVTNMLAGIGSVGAVLFVVAADEGWMPQSTEHLEALDALGVRHGILAVTRCDLADPRPAEAEAHVRLGASSLSDLTTVHVSGTTGQGIDRLRTVLAHLADRLPVPDRDADLRVWVDRAFTISGAGTVVTATLAAGSLRTGQTITLHPAGKRVTVRGLQSLGTELTQADAVARVAINLRGVHVNEVRRGDVLLTPHRWLPTTDADIRLARASAGDLPRELMLHIGSAAVPARIRPLGDDTARLAIRTPLPLRPGDRVALRDPGNHHIPTGAVVLDPRPPALTRRGAARRRAHELTTMDGRQDAFAELRRRRLISVGDLRALGMSPPQQVPQAAGWLLDEAHRDELANRLVELLTAYHRQEPLAEGLPTEAARRALELPDSPLLTLVLTAPAAAEVSWHGGKLRLGDPQLPTSLQEALKKVRETLRDNPFNAPTATDLHQLGLGEKELAAATRAGHLLQLAPGVVLLPSAEKEALQRLSTLRAPFTLSQARQALGTTRRVAVPLLERLARSGYTDRLDDGTHRLC